MGPYSVIIWVMCADKADQTPLSVHVKLSLSYRIVPTNVAISNDDVSICDAFEITASNHCDETVLPVFQIFIFDRIHRKA